MPNFLTKCYSMVNILILNRAKLLGDAIVDGRSFRKRQMLYNPIFTGAFLGTRPKGLACQLAKGGSLKGPATLPKSISYCIFCFKTGKLSRADFKFLCFLNCLSP